MHIGAPKFNNLGGKRSTFHAHPGSSANPICPFSLPLRAVGVDGFNHEPREENIARKTNVRESKYDISIVGAPGLTRSFRRQPHVISGSVDVPSSCLQPQQALNIALPTNGTNAADGLATHREVSNRRESANFVLCEPSCHRL